jgi:hypothetical protein
MEIHLGTFKSEPCLIHFIIHCNSYRNTVFVTLIQVFFKFIAHILFHSNKHRLQLIVRSPNTCLSHITS